MVLVAEQGMQSETSTQKIRDSGLACQEMLLWGLQVHLLTSPLLCLGSEGLMVQHLSPSIRAEMILSSLRFQFHIQAALPVASVLSACGFLSKHSFSPCTPSSFQVNFFSYVALATAALPTLEKNHGSVVVVSSLTGQCVWLSCSSCAPRRFQHTLEL